MNAIELATYSLANNFASAWVITVIAYGQLWAVKFDHMDVATMVSLTVLDVATTSKGKAEKLRGRCKDGEATANKMFDIAVQLGGKPSQICSKEQFIQLKKWAWKTHKRNAGETAEQLIRDLYGLPMYWHKDSTDGRVAGDMVVNGVHIQHKHQNATFAHPYK